MASELISKLEAAFGAASVSAKVTEALPLAPSAAGIVSVGSTEEVVELVRFAGREGCVLSPVGGGTHRFTGFPLSEGKPVIGVSLARFDTVTDFQPEDMTITCDPGVTLTQLQAVAAARRLRLGLDAPLASEATMGGITSTNTAGFTRLTFGTPRDTLIGVRAVMTEGREVKGGGKVVKNVAGYDLCKLFTGSWGTVGILTELTYKLTTVPDREVYLRWAMPDLATASRLGLELHSARLAPLSLFVTNEFPGEAGRPFLVVGLMGTPARVEWQTADFARRIGEAGVRSEVQPVGAEMLTALGDLQARLDAPFGVKFSLTLNDLVSTVSDLTSLPLSLTSHCGVGTLSVSPALGTDAQAAFRLLLAHLPQRGNVLWQKVPDFALPELARWGTVREDFALQKLLKGSLDPARIFNPGRFVGGL